MVVHMVGNAHIDPVWLWPWPAGVDEALASFRAAADRCDEHPELIYTRGEAWLYRWVERVDPELSARVDELVAAGRWHPTGGMVVQPDANLPTAEGWRRQLRHGRGYFAQRFGAAPRVAYNVDTFGHSATLPDLLAAEGMEAYVFHRPHPAQVALPAPAFRWRGTGGGDVLAFRIVPGYVTRGGDLRGQVLLAAEAADPAVGHTMCFYGVGNHGGGPTRANIEWILEHRDALDGIELRFSHPQAFFDAIAGARLPVVETELQHTFPGCYSVMSDVKRAQRRGEWELAAAGAAVDAFAPAGERSALHARLDDAWEDLLFCQFHDVLAGTSIPSAWDGVRALQGRARIAGEEVAVEATRAYAARTDGDGPHRRLLVLNPGPEPWAGLLEAEPYLDFDLWGERWLSDEDGRPLPHQLVQPEAQAPIMSRVPVPLAVPAGGTGRVLVREDARPAPAPHPDDLAVSATRLANARLAVGLRDGGIAGLALDGRPLLGGAGLHLRHDAADTWVHDLDHFPEPVSERLTGAWTVEESGPLRASVRLEAALGAARVRWSLSLHAGDPVLRMALEVLWGERFKLLQLALELAEPPRRWTDALPGGAVERTPGRAEWPVGGWSRIRLGGADLALVTPDAASLSLAGRTWQWTLLRAPKMAWGGGRPAVDAGRAVHTDQGVHTFALDLHAGPELAPDRLDAAVRALAAPPVVVERAAGVARPPWGEDPPPHLHGPAEQRARGAEAPPPARGDALFAPIQRRTEEPR